MLIPITAIGINDVPGLSAGGFSGPTAQVTGSDFVSSGLATQDITGLSLPVSVNTWYEVEAFLIIFPQNTSGLNIGLFNTGTDGTSKLIIQACTTAGTIVTFGLGANGPAGSNICFDQVEQPIIIRGLVKVGAVTGGVIKVQGIKLSSSTYTCRVGSYLTATPRP
jgi:hypothetical protein